MKSSGGLIELYKASIKGTSRDPGSDECVECVTERERESGLCHLCGVCLCEKNIVYLHTHIPSASQVEYGYSIFE